MDPDHQGARDLRRDLRRSCRSSSSTSASCSAASRAATAPTASAPSGSCSRWPRSSSSRARSRSARRPSVGFLFRIAPMIAILTAVGVAGADPVRRRPAHLRAAASASTGSTSRSARCTCSRFGGISFYGIMLGGWASGSKYSFLGRDARRRPADLLRGLAGPGPGRRAHHRADAVADRDRPRPGGHVVLHPAVRRLPDLHDGVVRRDQPRAVRPRRGRRRAGRRLLHRVRRHRRSSPTCSPSTRT